MVFYFLFFIFLNKYKREGRMLLKKEKKKWERRMRVYKTEGLLDFRFFPFAKNQACS